MTVLGNMSYTLAQFLMLFAVVHLTDQATVGRYAYALAVTAPIFIFAGLKMRHVQVTDAAGENRSGEYVAVRLLTSALALAVCLVVAAVSDGPQRALLVAVAVFKAVEAQVDVLYGVMQREQRMDLIARSMVQRAVLGTAAFVAALAATGSTAAAVWATSVVTLAYVLVESRTTRSLGRSPWPEFSGVRLVRLSRLALPLGASVAIGSLTTNMPRYFLKDLSGAEAVGAFSTIAYVLVAVGIIGGSAAEAAAPRLANHYRDHDMSGFARITGGLALFGLVLGAAGILVSYVAGEQVLDLAFGPEYGKHASVLVILMLAATLQYLSLAVGCAVYAMRLFRVQVPINVAGLVVAVVAGYLFTLRGGLVGAAWSVVATQLVLALMYAALLATRLRRTSRHVPSTEGE